MTPTLDPSEWVFCTVEPSFPVADANPLFVFRETEGTTIVLQRTLADLFKLEYQFVSRRITARVYSALDAVGFLAAITAVLAQRMIPANVVSAYHHDHIFVPADRASEALSLLEELSARSASRSVDKIV